MLTTDDPSQPCLTIRTWILGAVSCVLLSFVNQFFNYRTNQISVNSIFVQILALPVGRWMARVLPPTIIRIPLLDWSFSLNPGPFNMKEHVVTVIIANSGTGGIYAVHIITILKAFYHRGINVMAAILLTQTTQLLGFGWAGLFRKYLVDSPYMWWPGTLVVASLFRALNEEERRVKGGVTRLQFFLICMICSFSYYIVPNYFFPAISSISILCLIWKDSIPIHQIGSGMRGLGVDAIGFDWAIASMIGSPIAAPTYVFCNVLAGYVILVYILLPLCYWSNLYDARRFTFLSSHLESIASLASSVIANASYFGTAWWLLSDVPHICETNLLPKGSPWTCPSDTVFFSSSVIWGVVGPRRMFGPDSIYSGLNYFFLLGLFAPATVYLFHRLFLEKKWIRLINFPVIFAAAGYIPLVKTVNFNCWFIVGFVFNYWVLKHHKQWWGRYAYVLSAALDAGTSFMAVIAFFTLGNYNINSVNWWGGVTDDYCQLAKCPTELGAYIPKGCPELQ
ncbi:hypothetical protein ZIOFF_072540 [Zingiber officinale]|uniref:Uncharacterized protein n=2 Tax=Zingiber officinale TaxID=94328 RepID=A0A8J5C694_ZINOF|nr:hypothetical protein ZIOFF_072540 [Zingiber officinale]